MNGLSANFSQRQTKPPQRIDQANTVRDVAGILRTSERHVWRLLKSGDLKAKRLGKRCVRIFDSEIERYRQTLTDLAA